MILLQRLSVWLAASVLAVTLTGCGYNDIQSADEATRSAWSEVINQYQRRSDLIPNLVNTVKGYAEQEREVMVRVTEAPARVGQVSADPSAAGAPLPFDAVAVNCGICLSLPL